jgi:putative ABC transport system ATP-binding protein
LLDEPTASLDTEATEAVEALVAAWLERSDDRAYLWTSHDPAQLERVSSRSVAVGTR